MRVMILLLAMTTLFQPGCKEETCQGSFCLNTNAEILVQVNGELVPKDSTLIIGNVAVGETVVGANVRFTNLGDADLVVTTLSLNSQPPGALTLGFNDGAGPTAAAPWTVAGANGGASPSERTFEIVLVRTDADAAITGTLQVSSNSSLNDAMELNYPIEVVDLIPKLTAPEEVNFENVTDGNQETRPLVLINEGNTDLNIHAIELSGGSSYSLAHDGKAYAGSDEEPQQVTFGTPITVPAGQNISVDLTFAPSTPDPYPGQLVLFSNDPETGKEGASVVLKGNMFGACFTTNPKTVSFGSLPVGKSKAVDVQIISCGTKALEVSSITVAAGSEDEFSVSLPGGGGPIVLEAGEKSTFTAVYTPSEASPLDPEGEPIPDPGKLLVMTNTFVPEREVKVVGSGAQCCACPAAVAQVKQGELVPPQTNLELLGEASHTPYGEIVEYEWQVEQPEGSTAVFLPSNTVANPTFLANTAGVYTFTLRVWDDEGLESCVADIIEVEAKPDEAIHVELLWHNELDLDLSDDEAADLDLHFLWQHPAALGNKSDYDLDGENDAFFDTKWDCYYQNPKPNWGASLDLDDTTGAGPENVNFKDPDLEHGYRVGVHYWPEDDLGASDVTLRFYVKGDLVEELTVKNFLIGQMWDAATVTWDGEQATIVPRVDAEGNPKVMDAYPIPPGLPHP
jgi:hypothetical protein